MTTDEADQLTTLDIDLRVAPWRTAFEVDGNPDGHLTLVQVNERDFLLRGRLRYLGETGLEDQVSAETLEDIREVGPDTLPGTDLASVPPLLRWLVGTYGAHTPAALIHDRLIRDGRRNAGPVTDAQADRYFRFMLKAVGIPVVLRWIMWTAVALRTRWAAGGRTRLLLAAWVVLASIGLTAVVSAGVDLLFETGTPFGLSGGWLLLLSVLAIGPASLLWEGQYGAGLVASLVVPWILPPALLAAAGYGVYWTLERVAAIAGIGRS